MSPTIRRQQHGRTHVLRIDRPDAANSIDLATSHLLALAMEHLLTGTPIDAQHALELGLINRVVPAEEVFDQALALADPVCANGPVAVHASKSLARAVLAEDWGWRLNGELTAWVMGSEDAARARRTDGKRHLAWQGR